MPWPDSPSDHGGALSAGRGGTCGGLPPLPPELPRTWRWAVGLRSALLHCSSFRYFHSPCRVLCTFRSPYLCNIGCRADRGVLLETPRRIRLHFQATLHRRRQQSAGNTSGSGHGKRDPRSHELFALGLARRAFPCSCPVPPSHVEKWLPVMALRFVHPSPARSARGRRPRREAELFPAAVRSRGPFQPPGNSGHLPLVPRSAEAVTPFGSHSSLAVTEKDTMVFSSSANRYA